MDDRVVLPDHHAVAQMPVAAILERNDVPSPDHPTRHSVFPSALERTRIPEHDGSQCARLTSDRRSAMPTLSRRAALAGAAGLLAAPAIARAAAQSTLRFSPQQDLVVLDPVATTAYMSRNHGYMVFDTLYGMDAQFQPQPQMIEGHKV